MDSRLYTPDTNVFFIDTEVYVHSWHQGLCPGVTGCDTTAGRFWFIIHTVLMSHPLTFISWDPSRSNCFARDFGQTPTSDKLSLPGYRHFT